AGCLAGRPEPVPGQQSATEPDLPTRGNDHARVRAEQSGKFAFVRALPAGAGGGRALRPRQQLKKGSGTDKYLFYRFLTPFSPLFPPFFPPTVSWPGTTASRTRS